MYAVVGSRLVGPPMMQRGICSLESRRLNSRSGAAYSGRIFFVLLGRAQAMAALSSAGLGRRERMIGGPRYRSG